MTIKYIKKKIFNDIAHKVQSQNTFKANLTTDLLAQLINTKVSYAQALQNINNVTFYNLTLHGTTTLRVIFAGKANATGNVQISDDNGQIAFQQLGVDAYIIYYTNDSKRVILVYQKHVIVIGFDTHIQCENFVALFRSGLPSTVSRAPSDRADTHLHLTLRFE